MLTSYVHISDKFTQIIYSKRILISQACCNQNNPISGIGNHVRLPFFEDVGHIPETLNRIKSRGKIECSNKIEKYIDTVLILGRG